MAREMTREERRQAVLAEAERLVDQLEAWYDEHEDASFGEIEKKAREVRRELMGRALEIIINGRDTGNRPKRPTCEQCGTEMDFKGYRPWTVKSLEGDVELERAYYTCPHCDGETLFPPR